MNEKYSDELLNFKINTEVMDGVNVERHFFAISEDELKNVFHVSPKDSLEIAKKKINEVIYTDEFLYKFFHKDPLIWELKEFIPGYWTVPVKEEKILDKKSLLELGYSLDEIKKMRLPAKRVEVKKEIQQKLTVKFARRKPENTMSDEALKAFYKKYDTEFRKFLAHEDLYSILLKQRYSSPKTRTSSKYDCDKMLYIPDVELHLGKLASKFDSTDSYDYKKALYRYSKIILETEKIQDMYKASQICMTIGNDFYNTDTEQNTTTAGTEQHNDTRFQQMIATGITAHIWAIERMKQKCDKVILKYNPGNHDYLVDYTLFMQLYMLYKNDPKVEIDCKVQDVRWANSIKFGNTLVICAHGKTPDGKALNDDKLAEIPYTMFKEETRNADNIVILAGHLHNATENNFSSRKKSQNGVTVIRSGSPSGDGAWDSGNVYSSDKSHQVYVFDKERGLYSTINIALTKDELEKGFNLSPISDSTNYLETIESALENETDKIISEEIKGVKSKCEKEIRRIDKKYKEIMLRLENILGNPNISEEKKQEILSLIGYDDEVKPFQETLQDIDNGNKMSLKRK